MYWVFDFSKFQMQILPLVVITYFALHSYLLKVYGYHQLSGHMLYIILLQIYLSYYKQSAQYTVLKEIAQKRYKQDQSQNQQMRICTVCNRVKPPRYYHCRRCKICIYRMDHHCQWVSNCIGQFNSKPYLHFLFNLFLHSTIVFFYIFVWNFSSVFNNHERSIYLLTLIIPLTFIVFETHRLLKDFYSMVKFNQTLIESYKKVTGKQQPILKNLAQFMGNSSFILWCLPIYLPFQNPSKSSNLFERTMSTQEAQGQPQDHTFADEYLYGKDDQQEFFQEDKRD